MPIRETIICLFIMLIPISGAYADATVEIRKQRGLLILENFQQSAGMTYQYSGHDANIANANYSTNKFEEIYRILLAGAIVDRHLFNFQLNGDLWLSQVNSSGDTQGSSSSSGSKYQYNFAASAFDRKWHPINLHSSRTLSTVANAFTPAFDADNTSNGIDIYLQKGPVPTRIRYERHTLDLSGGGVDSSSISNSVFMSGTHNYRDFSVSSLSGSWSRSTSTSQETEATSGSYAVGFGNNLIWGQERNYSFGTILNWQKTETDGVPQLNITLDETLLGHPGKALDMDLTYRYRYNSTTTLEGADQTYSTNALAASVTHHLFQSLDTRLRGQVSHSDLLGGTEDTYSGSGSLTYRKKFSAYTLLTVAVYGEHAVTDRQGNVASVTIRDEPHTVTQPNETILLDVPGPLQPGSVTVTGFQDVAKTIVILFTRDIDYAVDDLAGRITWIGLPPNVPDIRVTYVALVDPSLKYATDTENINATLSLLSGRYTFIGSINNQDQTLISGRAQNNLRATTIKRLRFQGRATGTIYGLEYQDYSSGPSQYQYVEGWWLHSRTTPIWSMTLQARDRYTNYDPIGTSGGYGQNTFSASANYTRSLGYGLLLSLAANLVDTRRAGKDASDAVSAKANLRARFNMLDINLTGQSSWRFFGNAATRDDYFRFDIMRYF